MNKVYVERQSAQPVENETERTDYRRRLHIAAAAVLGASVDELETAFAEGRTLREIAEDRGIELTRIRAAMKLVHQQQIQRAIDGGELSQGQADVIQSQANLAPWVADDDYLSRLASGS